MTYQDPLEQASLAGKNILGCTQFFFVRHGETDWNKNRVIMGREDIGLNQTGFEQAERAAHVAKHLPIQTIITSPAKRAWQTARAIHAQLPRPLYYHMGFIEHHPGSWEGRYYPDICAEQGIPVDQFPTLPADAELFEFLDRRVVNALQHAVELYGEDILVVAHDGIFAAFTKLLTGKMGKSKNAEIYQFCFKDNAWQVSLCQ